MKTFNEVKVGDIIYFSTKLPDEDKWYIFPTKILHIEHYYDRSIAIKMATHPIDLNKIYKGKKARVYVYNNEVDTSVINRYVSTDYQLLENSLGDENF
jgi:hypothetical protein